MNRHSFSERTIKPWIRFIYYKNQRKKVAREKFVKRHQDRLIRQQYAKDTEKLIVFLVPGAEWTTGKDRISGGVLSIASLYKETKEIEAVHGSALIMCTFPLEHLLIRHTNFESNIDIFRFDQLTRHFENLQELILHIPEYLVEHFDSCVSKSNRQFLSKIPKLQINILNQNIRLMPAGDIIASLKDAFTNNITITTAHVKYCTRALREVYGVPLHFFSTFASPEGYIFKPYPAKENLLLLSPDDPVKNQIVIDLLKREFPDLQVRVINGLTYDAYKELIGKAKWSITFGEGLDFYFIEPVFSGSISFAIYNEDFFTPDFKEIPTVYPSFEDLKNGLVSDIKAFDKMAEFKLCQEKQFLLCSKYYSKEQYRKNIAAFYKGEFTFS